MHSENLVLDGPGSHDISVWCRLAKFRQLN